MKKGLSIKFQLLMMALVPVLIVGVVLTVMSALSIKNGMEEEVEDGLMAVAEQYEDILENEPERGGRCLKCFKFRLLRAAEYASAHGFEVLTTTLASSRWKSLDQVNEAGRWACAQVQGATWWDQNWRKGGLQERRNQIIKEENFYTQLYCGCEYSQKKPGL